MAAHFKALLGVVLATLILAGAFFAFYKPPTTQGPAISLVDKFKSEGVPPLKGATLDGVKVNLEQFKGKSIIINFWASWCEPCIEEVPSLIRLIQKTKGDVVLLAISADSARSEIEAFVKSFPGLKTENIYLLWDDQKDFMRNYGVERLPESFIVGKDLKLIRKVVGSINWDHPDTIDFFKGL